MNLFRAVATVSSLTLLSRITGLARDMIISRMFGASAETDAFNVAFRLPNLLRRLFGEGAFQQAFVPMLADVQGAQRRRCHHVVRRARRVGPLLDPVGRSPSWGSLAAPALVWLIASGLARDPAAFDLATVMTRWMFPYILFMSLVALAAGVLNTYRRFAVPAFTPVLLNLSFIGCALWLAPRLSQPIMALAFAVLLGGVLQLGLQWTALRRAGLQLRIGGARSAFADPDVRRVAALMLPAIFSVSVAQLSIIINTNIASHLATGSVTWLAFADRLMEFPTALLGVALGTVLLPSLSSAFSERRMDDYSRLLDWGLRLIFLLALPAAVGLGMLADGIVAVLFQGREFTASGRASNERCGDRLRGRPDRADRGEDPGARLLCTEGHPHAGEDCHRRAGGDTDRQPRARAAGWLMRAWRCRSASEPAPTRWRCMPAWFAAASTGGSRAGAASCCGLPSRFAHSRRCSDGRSSLSTGPRWKRTPWQRAALLAALIAGAAATYFAALRILGFQLARLPPRPAGLHDERRRPWAASDIPYAGRSAELLQHRAGIADFELAREPRCSES